jgi:outer membrane protein assembly factor BamB
LYAGEHSLGLIDVNNPRPLWTVPHKLSQGAAFRPRATKNEAVCGGLQEIGSWRITDGLPLWRYPGRHQLGVPVIHDQTIFFGDGHELVALNLVSGETLWRFSAVADTQISYAPTLGAETVFVGPGDGRLYALNIADGKLKWVVNRMHEWQYLRQIQVHNNVLVAGSYKEKLYGIDPVTGRQYWEFSAGNFINSQHLAAGTAYLWSPTGWLYAIDTATGSVRWRHRTTDYTDSSHNWAALLAELVTVDDRLFALDLGNTLHVLSTRTGQELCSHRLAEPLKPFVLPLLNDRLMFGTNQGDLLLVHHT